MNPINIILLNLGWSLKSRSGTREVVKWRVWVQGVRYSATNSLNSFQAGETFSSTLKITCHTSDGIAFSSWKSFSKLVMEVNNTVNSCVPRIKTAKQSSDTTQWRFSKVKAATSAALSCFNVTSSCNLFKKNHNCLRHFSIRASLRHAHILWILFTSVGEPSMKLLYQFFRLYQVKLMHFYCLSENSCSRIESAIEGISIFALLSNV